MRIFRQQRVARARRERPSPRRPTQSRRASAAPRPPPPSTSDGEAEARKRRRIRFSTATQAETDAGTWVTPAADPAPKWGRGVISVHHDDSISRSAVRASYPASAWRPPPNKNAISLATKGASTEDSGVKYGLTAHRPFASSTVDPASPGRSSETTSALDSSSLSTTDDLDVGGLAHTRTEATQQVSGSTGLTAHRTAHRTRASSMVDPVSPGRSSETTSALDSSSLSTTDDMGGGGFTNKKPETSPQDSGISGAAAHGPRASSTADPASPGRSSETTSALDSSSLSTNDDLDRGGLPNKKPKASLQDSGFSGGAASKPRAPSPADPASPGRSSKTATTLGASSLSTTDVDRAETASLARRPWFRQSFKATANPTRLCHRRQRRSRQMSPRQAFKTQFATQTMTRTPSVHQPRHKGGKHRRLGCQRPNRT